jgi:hypothetical protein
MSYFPGIQRQRPFAGPSSFTAPTGVNQVYSGQGLPQITPTVQGAAATYESLNLNLFFDWDTNSQVWRSRGQAREITSLNLASDQWTRLPATVLLTRIDEYRIFDSSGVLKDSFDQRLSTTDGWPEVNSLTAYTGLSIHCFGEIVI